jgi:hypothetical protein
MKTAIYIEDGVIQLVLTPESDFERNAVRAFEDKQTTTAIKVGAFYDCSGGWTRHARIYNQGGYNDDNERSIIMRIETDKPIPE